MKPLPKRVAPIEDYESVVAPLPSMDRPIQRSPVSRRSITVVLAIASLGATGAVAYRAFALSPERSISAERSRFATVAYAPFAEFVPATGALIPLHTVFLDTVEGGRVTDVLIEEGERVSAGTPLARLENTELQLQIMAREAAYIEQLGALARTQMDFDQTLLAYDRDLAESALQIALMRSDLERRLPLERTSVPKAETERLRAELAHQEAMHDRIAKAKARDRAYAKRNLDQLRESLDRMADSLALVRGNLAGLAITAPIDGQLSLLDVRLGEVVPPGARVGQVDQLDGYKLRALVDEFYLGRLVIGQRATAEIGGEPVELEIRRLSPSVENRQFAVEFTFSKPPPLPLRRGQSLRVRIDISETAKTLTVPFGPFFEETGGLWVFVQDPAGRSLERRTVTFGRRNSERIEVLEGLSEGEVVLVSSYEGLAGEARLSLQTH
ncbi:MAG: efflux RND transporter periplasmic adaptor subunit [Myxococcota bacterium]